MTAAPVTLDTLDTPCLVLDETRMTRNVDRLNGLMAGHGVQSVSYTHLRAHET